MHLTLWIIAGLLAAAYLFGGAFKLVVPKEKIASSSPHARWVDDFGAGSVRAIGGLEVLGAIGLVAPAVLDVAPGLVPFAASGLALIMIGAVITRIRRREFPIMVVDLVYLALAVFVAWGRFGPEPFGA